MQMISLPASSTNATETMKFCGGNETLSKPWVNHGLNICFAHTLTSSLKLTFAVVLGIAKFVDHKRKAILLSPGKIFFLNCETRGP